MDMSRADCLCTPDWTCFSSILMQNVERGFVLHEAIDGHALSIGLNAVKSDDAIQKPSLLLQQYCGLNTS